MNAAHLTLLGLLADDENEEKVENRGQTGRINFRAGSRVENDRTPRPGHNPRNLDWSDQTSGSDPSKKRSFEKSGLTSSDTEAEPAKSGLTFGLFSSDPNEDEDAGSEVKKARAEVTSEPKPEEQDPEQYKKYYNYYMDYYKKKFNLSEQDQQGDASKTQAVVTAQKLAEKSVKNPMASLGALADYGSDSD